MNKKEWGVWIYNHNRYYELKMAPYKKLDINNEVMVN